MTQQRLPSPAAAGWLASKRRVASAARARSPRASGLVLLLVVLVAGCQRPASESTHAAGTASAELSPGVASAPATAPPLGQAVPSATAAAPATTDQSVATASPPAAGDSAAAGAQPAAAASPVPPPLFAGWPQPQVVLVLTGQQMGYVEPCGCSGLENQKGGLARRHTLIRQLATERQWPVVPLDVGSQVKRFGKQQEVKFEHVVKGLRTMGYRAITLGSGDLALSPSGLLAAMAGPDSTIRDFVSANVAVLSRELMPPLVIIEAGGRRIGVTAVLSEKFERQLRGDEIVHEPPAAALASAAEKLRAEKCDLYVLLAHASLDEARRLAQAAPLFDLVVAAGETNLPSRELEVLPGGKTRLMQVGLKAMHAGVVGWFADAAVPLRYESVPLDARFADSPEMLQLLADYQAQLKELGLEGLEIKAQPHPTGRRFVGSEQCGECHTQAYAKWSSTPHAHALDSLVKPPNSRGSIARHHDPECLSCHVTGWEPQRYFPYVSGYLGLDETPLLAHNGCENCHGPGSAHVAAESDGGLAEAEIAKLREAMRLPLAGGAAERKCLECHDEDNSPDFHKPGAFEKYWDEVEHRGKD